MFESVNWNAVGAVGEILGVIAVVVTLLLLVREIRLNAQSLAMTALRDTTSQWNQWSEMMATSEGLADIVAKGNQSYDALSVSESLRYGAYVQSFFDNAESYRSMVVDYKAAHDLDVLDAIVRRKVQIPGFHAWLQDNCTDYNQEFLDWIESVRISESGTGEISV